MDQDNLRDTRALDRYRRRGAMLFSSVFVLMYNPFVVLGTSVRFALMAAIPVLSVAYCYHHLSRVSRPTIPGAFVVLSAFLIAVSVRTNPVVDLDGSSLLVISMMQAWLTVLVVICSCLVFSLVGRDAFINAIRVYSTTVAVFLAVATRLSVASLVSAPVAAFNSSTYQQLGDVLAIATILQVVQVHSERSTGASGLVMRLGRIVLIAAFLFMVMQNQARGEMIALLAALGIMVMPRVAGVAGGLVFLFPNQTIDLFAKLGFQGALRLKDALAADDLGQRDVLFRQAWDLLNDLRTLSIGRGSNYFQLHYNYSFGRYPHNIYLEAAIVGGVVGCAIVVWAYIIPVVRGYSNLLAGKRVDLAALSLGLYLVLVSAKSGSLTTGWSIGLFAPMFSVLTDRYRSQREIPLVANPSRAQLPAELRPRTQGGPKRGTAVGNRASG